MRQVYGDNGKEWVSETPPLETITAKELSKMRLPPVEFIIDRLMPVGLGVLAAPSKTGKSFMVLDMAACIAKGSLFLGYSTNKAEVLYLALEDSKARVKDRLGKILGKWEYPAGLYIATEAKRLVGGELAEQIDGHMKRHDKTKLVIIDTFQKIRPPRKAGKDPYETDYEVLGELQEICKKWKIGVLLVHHTRKKGGKDSDPFELILGSTAIAGASDYMIVLDQKQDDDYFTLHAKGRDIENIDLAIEMDWNAFRWQRLGNAQDIYDRKMRAAYQDHPAIKTLKHKLAEIEADPDEPIKEYIVTASDFQNDIRLFTRQQVGTSARDFNRIIQAFDPYLLEDGIKHTFTGVTEYHRGDTGKYHHYKYLELIK